MTFTLVHIILHIFFTVWSARIDTRITLQRLYFVSIWWKVLFGKHMLSSLMLIHEWTKRSGQHKVPFRMSVASEIELAEIIPVSIFDSMCNNEFKFIIQQVSYIKKGYTILREELIEEASYFFIKITRLSFIIISRYYTLEFIVKEIAFRTCDADVVWANFTNFLNDCLGVPCRVGSLTPNRLRGG